MEELMEKSAHDILLDSVLHYRMPEAAKQLLTETQPVILCGITGAGKNTLSRELVAGGGYEEIVSHTTRQPRENHGKMEVNGTEYHFISEPEMLDLVRSGGFIEVKPVHTNFYGTSIMAYQRALDNGNIPLLEIDVKGAEEFVKTVPALRPIFLLPPSFEVWQTRLKGRGNVDHVDLTHRLISAVGEIKLIMNNSAFQLVINTEKDITAKMIRSHAATRDDEVMAVAEQLVKDIETWLKTHVPSV